MIKANNNNSFDVEVTNRDENIGRVPTAEYPGLACMDAELESGIDEDYIPGSSGLTPVQELAWALGLADLNHARR